GREPLVEPDVRQQLPEVRLHARQQNRDAAVGFLPNEFLDSLDDDGIRVAYPLEPQHEVFDVVVLDPLAQRFQILLEIGCGAEKQFALEVIDDSRRIARVTRNPADPSTVIYDFEGE